MAVLSHFVTENAMSDRTSVQRYTNKLLIVKLYMIFQFFLYIRIYFFRE